MPPPAVPKSRKRNKRASNSEEEDDNIDSDSDLTSVTKSRFFSHKNLLLYY